MKTREIIITSFIVLLICSLFSINYFANKFILRANNVYRVYLNGSTLGYLTDDDELYNIINNRQKEIRDKYKVTNVYPPENFEIVKTSSYNVEISSAEQIYDKMAKLESFTIEGYIITFQGEKDNLVFNVLNKEDFDSAINNFVLSFVSSDDYKNFINNTQPVIETTGKIINTMYFDETITIKKGYVA